MHGKFSLKLFLTLLPCHTSTFSQTHKQFQKPKNLYLSFTKQKNEGFHAFAYPCNCYTSSETFGMWKCKTLCFPPPTTALLFRALKGREYLDFSQTHWKISKTLHKAFDSARKFYSKNATSTLVSLMAKIYILQSCLYVSVNIFPSKV